MADGCVTCRFEILVYYRVRSVFETTCALLNTAFYQLDVKSRQIGGALDHNLRPESSFRLNLLL